MPENQKVLSGRRITLSQACCDELHIKEGDWVIVEWDKEKGTITITPAEIKPRRGRS